MAIVYFSSSPESFIQQQASQFAESTATESCFVVEFDHAADYLLPPQVEQLCALVAFEREDNLISLHFSVVERSEETRAALKLLVNTPDAYCTFAHLQSRPWLSLNSPLPLSPIDIAKPWGREVWYTGIEVRGQSQVGVGEHLLPLPWLLTLFAQALTQTASEPVVLLKLLVPFADKTLGNLYFEAHREKQEVYLVTDVECSLWPASEGEIKLGFSQAKRAEFASDQAFKDAYLAAVNDYYQVRSQIDARLDVEREQRALALDQPLLPAIAHELAAVIPESLQRKEQQYREAMDSFSQTHKLRVGDVVKVPVHVPHALQHGVTCIEFQTAHYEREILSFGQKVLTQSGWDTEEALREIVLDAPELTAPPIIFHSKQVQIESIVRFENFEVKRIRIFAGQTYLLELGARYGLLMHTGGDFGLVIDGKAQPVTLAKGQQQAYFLPATTEFFQLLAGNTDAELVLALPR